MRRSRIRSIPLFLLLSVAVESSPIPTARAQPQPGGASVAAVEVAGDIAKPGRLTVKDLEPLGAVTAAWEVHGQTHTVVGVPLEKVLRRAGWEPGMMGKSLPPAEKRAGYKRVVLATARDGFQAVFSAAELTEGMGKTVALLVFKIDGKPLREDQGPLRVVVLSDGEPSRSLFQLQRLDIVDMRHVRTSPSAASSEH